MLDRRRSHTVTDCRSKTLEAFGTILADPGDGGGDQSHTEQISHQRGQTLLRQQLIVRRYSTKAPIRLPYCAPAHSPKREIQPAFDRRTPRSGSHGRDAW